MSISCEIILRWMPQNTSDGKSTLVQVMAWCRQATSHYLSQCWPRSMLPYDITRPPWVKQSTCIYHKYHTLYIVKVSERMYWQPNITQVSKRHLIPSTKLDMATRCPKQISVFNENTWRWKSLKNLLCLKLTVDTFRQRQNGCKFVDTIFECNRPFA